MTLAEIHPNLRAEFEQITPIAQPKQIYLASSWRNTAHDGVLHVLRTGGYKVFNYRETNASFHWREIDPEWESWTMDEYAEALHSDKAVKAFENDMKGLKESDTLILIEPSGISAHMELGYAIGAGMRTLIFHSDNMPEPELMSKMADGQTDSMLDVLQWLETPWEFYSK